VWAWTVSAPVYAFAQAADFAGKTVITLPTCGGQPGKFNLHLEEKVKCEKFVGKDAFVHVESDNDEVLTEKVTAWLQGL
jgi:flavodoxin